MPLYRDLTKAERDQVLAGVALASRLAEASGPPTLAQLQSLYDALLQDPDRPESAVMALGFGFGSLLADQDWLDWAIVLDEAFGDDYAVAVRGRQLGCSPLSMIQYRLEDGEAWALGELVEATLSQLRQLRQQAASR